MLSHPTLDQLNALGLHGLTKGFRELEHKPEARGLDILYGLVFHPKFAENRTCYLTYTLAAKDKKQPFLPEGSRISRFTVTKTDPPRIDPASEEDLFWNDDSPRHLLAHLQADIFHLEEGLEPAAFTVSPGDHSIQVHCCHSPMRELEVLQQLAGGNRNKDVAERLFITEETVKVHVKHIMDKIGASDRTQAVAIAVRRGIIQI